MDDVVVLPGGILDGDAATRAADREALTGRLASRRFDVALQLHGGGRTSNPFVQALGARVTAGNRTSDATPLDRWIPYERYQPEIARCLDIVALVGASPVGFAPRLAATRADRDALARELPTLAAGDRWVVVHPGATDPRRRWPADRFAEVAGAIRDRGQRVVVTGTGNEAGILTTVATLAASEVILAPDLSVPALVGLLAGADVVVANDSGPLHVAIALDTATVGLFWFPNLLMAGPLSRRRHRVAISWTRDCPVCGADAIATRCSHDPSFVEDVPVGAVLHAVDDLLDRSI